MIFQMNVIKTETPFVVKAKSTGSQEKVNEGITCHFIESSHILCLDKVELLKGQFNSCKRLLKELSEHDEKEVIEIEITKLNRALEVVR